MSSAPALDSPPDEQVARFEAAGLDAADCKRWRETLSATAGDSPFRVHWPETWSAIASAADPALAISAWLGWIDDDAGDESGARRDRWGASIAFRRSFVALAGSGPALASAAARDWIDLDPDAWRGGFETRRELRARLDLELDGALGDSEFRERLRRFKAIETLRIAHFDIVEGIEVDDVARRISLLADVLVGAALGRARADVARRFGAREPEGGLAILALGKLGGDELNYSSDIDLNFILDPACVISRASDGETSNFDPAEFWTRVVERMIRHVTEFTSRGQLYRLDTRLRPDAGTGRLVWSISSALDYYYASGRNWERQALIRMRFVAGDEALGARFISELRPFTFPSELTQEHLVEMRSLKLQIERMAARGGDEREEIKIGEGGIRDVEYIVQYLQLVHGAQRPELRVANVFDVLERLERAEVLDREQTDILRRGYRFLRRVEHRLQLDEMLQTHRLPVDEVPLRRLARGMGCASIEAFRGRLARHAAEIRRVYRLLFDQATQERSIETILPAVLELPIGAVPESDVMLLASYGFADPARAFRILRALAGHEGESVDLVHARAAFRRILFDLLREMSLHPDPDRTLTHFESCVRSLGARTVFYQLLAESEDILELFVDLCARSNLVVEIIERRPDIFDEVVDCMLTGYTFDRDSLCAQVEALIGAGPDALAELRRVKYTHILLTAIRELEGRERLRVTLERVADIAEALLRGVVLDARTAADEKFGRFAGAPPRWVILALGKLGGREMSFRSDVDIVLVYDRSSPDGDSAGDGPRTDRGFSVEEYFERFTQLFLERCAAADFRGPLVDVDVRLRPLGSQSSLAVSLDAWRRYFARDPRNPGPGETWERLAFLRARPVAGDIDLGDEITRAIRTDFVLGGDSGPALRDQIVADVRAMRTRLEEHAGASDLKRGAGGLMDIEFIAQALQLIHGGEAPGIFATNTAQALERLQEAGFLSWSDGAALFASYRLLRWIECRFSLVGHPGDVLANLDDDDLDLAIRRMGYKSTGEERAVTIFRSELDYHRAKNREIFDRLLPAEVGENDSRVGPGPAPETDATC